MNYKIKLLLLLCTFGLARKGHTAQHAINTSPSCGTLTHIEHVALDKISFERQDFNKRVTNFGNKTAHLEELKKIVDTINQSKQYHNNLFAVPSFFGISHDVIVNFLKSVYVDQKNVFDIILTEWARLQHAQENQEKLCPTTKTILAHTRSHIKKAFEHKIFEITDAPEQKKFSEFVEKIPHNRLLMVRSTGCEDSITSSNAGGNESVPSATDPRAISSAIGRVIASYFSEKSIAQRLIMHDPLEHVPFMPVLLQEMVQEESNQMVISGIIFSQEAEGQTPEVVSIDACWGFGEGIVSGLVGCDRFSLSPSGHIHSLIAVKHNRTGFDNQNNSILVANPENLQHVPCLDKEQLWALDKIARAAEYHFKYPQDLEFVIQNNIINIVQTRPIVHPNVQPSYVKEEYINQSNESTQNSLVPVFIIGTAGGAAQIIYQSKEIIIAQRTQQALDTFLKCKHKKSIKAIIIGEQISCMSHAATIFRGAGKIVLYAENINSLRSNIQKNIPFIIDAQRGALIPFKKCAQFSEPLSAIEHNAWLVHPLPKKISILPCYINTDKVCCAQQIVPENVLPNASMRSLLQQLRVAKTECQILDILKTVRWRVEQKIRKGSQLHQDLCNAQMDTDEHLQVKLHTIYTCFLESLDEIVSFMPHWLSNSDNQSRISWLYPQLFLEALIEQVPQAQFVSDDSLSALLKRAYDDKAWVEKLGLAGQPHRAYCVQLAHYSEYALTDETAKLWLNYIKQFHLLSTQNQESMMKLISTLTDFNIMPLWINRLENFVDSRDQLGVQLITDKLLEEFAQAQEILNLINPLFKKLQTLSTDEFIHGFEQPKLFEKHSALLVDCPFKYLLSDQLVSDYKRSPPLAQQILLTVMTSYAHLFDLSIKALNGSQLYEDDCELQVLRFKQLLEKFLILLRTYASLMDQETQEQISEGIKCAQFRIVNATTAQCELRCSEKFSVINPTSYRINPMTLEDSFTLIHQLILLTIAHLQGIQNSNKMAQLSTPQLVDDTVKAICALPQTRKGYKVYCLGYNIDNKQLKYFFNIPLNVHSGTAQVVYDLEKKSTELHIQLITYEGKSGDRWRWCLSACYLFSEIMGIPFTQDPVLDEKRGTYSCAFLIPNAQEVPLIANFLYHLMMLSWPAGKSRAFEIVERVFACAGREDWNKDLEKKMEYLEGFNGSKDPFTTPKSCAMVQDLRLCLEQLIERTPDRLELLSCVYPFDKSRYFPEENRTLIVDVATGDQYLLKITDIIQKVFKDGTLEQKRTMLTVLSLCNRTKKDQYNILKFEIPGLTELLCHELNIIEDKDTLKACKTLLKKNVFQLTTFANTHILNFSKPIHQRLSLFYLWRFFNSAESIKSCVEQYLENSFEHFKQLHIKIQVKFFKNLEKFVENGRLQRQAQELVSYGIASSSQKLQDSAVNLISEKLTCFNEDDLKYLGQILNRYIHEREFVRTFELFKKITDILAQKTHLLNSESLIVQIFHDCISLYGGIGSGKLSIDSIWLGTLTDQLIEFLKATKHCSSVYQGMAQTTSNVWFDVYTHKLGDYAWLCAKQLAECFKTAQQELCCPCFDELMQKIQ